VYLTSAGRLVDFLACVFAYTMCLNKTATHALSNTQRGRTHEWDSRTFETYYTKTSKQNGPGTKKAHIIRSRIQA